MLRGFTSSWELSANAIAQHYAPSEPVQARGITTDSLRGWVTLSQLGRTVENGSSAGPLGRRRATCNGAANVAFDARLSGSHVGAGFVTGTYAKDKHPSLLSI